MMRSKANGPPDFAVYEGKVVHTRHKPVKHQLSYRVFSFFADLDKLDTIAARHRFFSHNRFNLFSFFDSDHGSQRPQNLAAYLRQSMSDFGLVPATRIRALFYPRILGFAFNPIVVFYCYDENDGVSAIFYQVNNTFGGRHTYLIPHPADSSADDTNPDANSTEEIFQSTQKLLHVSPFIDMDMRYDFRMLPPGDSIRLAIDVNDPEGLLLTAVFSGQSEIEPSASLLVLARKYPLMMVKIIGAIHWEAIKLMFKGLRLRAGAPTPANAITFVRG